MACPRDPGATCGRPWEAAASRRARSAGFARRSTSGSTPSSLARSKGLGRSLDRCDLFQGASGRQARVCGHHHRRGDKYGRAARRPGRGDRRARGETVLNRVPPRPRAPGPRRREPDGADRGMDRPGRPLSEAGNARSGLRGSLSQPACCATRLTYPARTRARGTSPTTPPAGTSACFETLGFQARYRKLA